MENLSLTTFGPELDEKFHIFIGDPICTISLMAAVQPEPWLRALITTTINNTISQTT
jgi:hypothetical protein